MRILCRSGHFAFYPDASSDISHFCSLYKTNLARENDYYTFPALVGLPDYSLPVLPYKNLPAVVRYEGQPWEVMRENGFVYSLTLKVLVPKLTIVGLIDMPASSGYFVSSTPIIQPGLLTKNGQRLMSYDAELDFGIQKLRVREFDYV